MEFLGHPGAGMVLLLKVEVAAVKIPFLTPETFFPSLACVMCILRKLALLLFNLHFFFTFWVLL